MEAPKNTATTTTEADATTSSPASSCDDTAESVDESIDGKSEISRVHELALQHALSINFEVIHESGPPHLRNFITRYDNVLPCFHMHVCWMLSINPSIIPDSFWSGELEIKSNNLYELFHLDKFISF